MYVNVWICVCVCVCVCRNSMHTYFPFLSFMPLHTLVRIDMSAAPTHALIFVNGYICINIHSDAHMYG
jgi:hypothetical protein